MCFRVFRNDWHFRCGWSIWWIYRRQSPDWQIAVWPKQACRYKVDGYFWRTTSKKFGDASKQIPKYPLIKCFYERNLAWCHPIGLTPGISVMWPWLEQNPSWLTFQFTTMEKRRRCQVTAKGNRKSKLSPVSWDIKKCHDYFVIKCRNILLYLQSPFPKTYIFVC